MDPHLNLEWFDKKYRQGEKPTLEDRAHLLAQLNLPFPERLTRRVEESLQQFLFELNRNDSYRPSIHIIAYALLFNLAPLTKIPSKKYDAYVKQYQEALEKHKDKIPFSRNF